MRLKSGNDYTTLLPHVALCFLLIGLDLLGWLSGIKALSERIINPVSSSTVKVGRILTQPFSSIGYLFSGPERIADLENRYAEALVRASQVETVSKENESLRNLLGSGALTDYRYEPVRTISLTGELVLSAGSAQGVGAGETVVDENNVLVGRVNRVSTWTSWVLPVSDTHSQVPVSIGGQKVLGTLTGGGETGEVLVEQNDLVREGEEVWTSGIQGDYVSGLLVGRVLVVEPETAHIYKKVTVQLLYQQGDFVYLVRGKK